MMKRFLFVAFAILLFNTNACTQGNSCYPCSIASINIRISNKKDIFNHWNNRKEQLTEYIRSEALDIVSLQEVSTGQLIYLISILEEYGVAGNNPKVVTGEEYLPILYRKKDFVCLDEGTFWLSETPDSIGSRGWDGKHPRRVTWAKLMCKKSNRTFCVVNTHLDHVGFVARQKGMELIKHRLKSTSNSIPVVLCGDMNFSSTSSAYYCALNDEFMMYDAYQVAKVRKGVTYSFHGFGNRPIEKRRMIDFVFITNQLEVKEIEIPKEEKMNGSFLTDHCPIIVKISF